MFHGKDNGLVIFMPCSDGKSSTAESEYMFWSHLWLQSRGTYCAVRLSEKQTEAASMFHRSSLMFDDFQLFLHVIAANLLPWFTPHAHRLCKYKWVFYWYFTLIEKCAKY